MIVKTGFRTPEQQKADNRFLEEDERKLAEKDEENCLQIIENEVKNCLKPNDLQAIQKITSNENEHRLWYWNIYNRKYHEFRNSYEPDDTEKENVKHNPINDNFALDSSGQVKSGYKKIFYKDKNNTCWSAFEIDIPELIHFPANDINKYPDTAPENQIREIDKEYVANCLLNESEEELSKFLSHLDIQCIKKYGSYFRKNTIKNKILPADTSIHHRVDGFISLVDMGEHKKFQGKHYGSVKLLIEQLKSKSSKS